jgi:hypothetical protein
VPKEANLDLLLRQQRFLSSNDPPSGRRPLVLSGMSGWGRQRAFVFRPAIDGYVRTAVALCWRLAIR